MQDYYSKIKETLINNEVYKKVKDYSKNKNDLETYYNVGKLLIKAQGGEKRAKYGNGLIKEYSIKLEKDIGKKYSITTLKYMRQFYLFSKSQPMVDQSISWSHYTVLLALKDNIKIKYYIKQIKIYNLSRNKLREKIKSKEYERLPQTTKDKLSLEDIQEYKITDFIKSPIIIRNNLTVEKVSEKVLQQLILEDIPAFLEQLGEDFTFIKNEYPIKVGDRYNYIDLLLFNIECNAYVVVELKVSELNKNHVGQIGVYMNYIDKHLKKINQNKTIGIIICKKDNKFVIEYCSNPKIFSATYILN